MTPSSDNDVSVVATVLNEYGSIPAWLGGLARQTRHPDELIIVDGGSNDGTLELLKSSELPFPLRVVSAPGANISAGRNVGIEAAAGEIIVVTDAGTVADSNWIARIVQPLFAGDEIDIVGGFFKPDAGNLWLETLGAATLPDASEIDARRFLPSSRSVAFRRRWFDGGFRYPEWLDFCEDVVFDLQLRGAGARQTVALGAIVGFSPRRGPLSFARQYFRYARGDGKAGLFFKRHVIRYATYLTGSIVLIRRRPAEMILAAVAALLYLNDPVARFRRRYPERWGNGMRTRIATVGLIAIQRLVGDVAKMIGYPVGLLWRYRTDSSARFWKTSWRYRRPDGSAPDP